MRILASLALLAGLSLVGCGKPSPPDHPRDAAGGAPAATPPTASPSPSTSTTTPPAKPAATAGITCLPWQVCGCNQGCAGIRTARADLRPGMKVPVVSGEQKGSTAVVILAAAKGGGETFALSDRGRDAPCMRSVTDANLMGYACATSGTGPVDPVACEGKCEP